jgi:hypothetical protein
VHRVESCISGWYTSLMGVLIGLNSLPKRPSNIGITFNYKEQPKKQENVARRKELKEVKEG